MPYIDSDIPNNIFFKAFVGETLRLLMFFFFFFLPKVCGLVSRILWQDGKPEKCHSFFKNIVRKHQEFSRLDNYANNLITQIVSKQNIFILKISYLFQLALTVCLFLSLVWGGW